MELFGTDITVLSIVGLVFFAFVGVAYSLFFKQLSAARTAEKRVGRFAAAQPTRAQSKKADPAASRRRTIQDTLKDIDTKQRYRASRSTNPPLRLRLMQAGLKMQPARFFVISGITGVVCAVIALMSGLPLMLVLAMGFVGALGLPRFWINRLRKKRQAAFTEELPNAVEVIVRGVKAGLPLLDCMRMIASEAKEPLRGEFRSIMDSLALGVPLDEAMGRLYERMPLPEANFLAIVIAIQSKAGGNLSEALGNLAKVLRERRKMRSKIVAMSTEAKASASIIGSLPLVVMGLVYLTSPDYISILWTEPVGQIVMGVSALVMLTGVLVMRRMINFDF